MSGIVGLVNLDGEPVNRSRLSQLTDFLELRGPDAKRIWIDGAVGFGHTLLKTADEAQHEEQPFTFDGKIWIVADARIDARVELVSKLDAKGRAASLDRPDVELILHSYHVWGQECLQHLLGDFAFAIWDVSVNTLFCARDHMGVKPFYYAAIGSAIIFSNTLDCIRSHPLVSSRLNDLAVADFLLFDANRERNTTLFADIQRIAPAHSVTWTKNGCQVRRYWTLPVDEPIQYRRLDDYTDRFKELLRTSVGDRLRTGRVGVFMSGGVDSPALAATARDLMRGAPDDRELTAFTWTFDGIDQERHYATQVANYLGIPIKFRDGNAEGIDLHWEQTDHHTPQPPSNPLILAKDPEFYRRVASHNRVVLYGEGPDTALYYEWRPYLRYLAARKSYGRLIREVLQHILLHRRIPLLPTIPKMMRERAEENPLDFGYPSWLNPELERRLDLPRRWAEVQHLKLVHPVRPEAYAALQGPRWVNMFEEYDAATTLAPLEFRHPYFDTRLLGYLLAVPALPWCRVKYLIRRAMRGSLPRAVLRRPKTPLHPNPWVELSRTAIYKPIIPAAGFAHFVDQSRVFSGHLGTNSTYEQALHPRRLNYWLKNLNV